MILLVFSKTALFFIMFCQEIYFNLRHLHIVRKPRPGLDCVRTFTSLIACLHSGHNHGGQVTLPRIAEMVFLPSNYLTFFTLLFLKWSLSTEGFFKNSFNLKNHLIYSPWRHNFPNYSRVKSLCLCGWAGIDSAQYDALHFIPRTASNSSIIYLVFTLY